MLMDFTLSLHINNDLCTSSIQNAFTLNHKIETWKNKPQILFIGYIKNLIFYFIFEIVWWYFLTKNNITI
jgi:hypothetical protein